LIIGYAALDMSRAEHGVQLLASVVNKAANPRGQVCAPFRAQYISHECTAFELNCPESVACLYVGQVVETGGFHRQGKSLVHSKHRVRTMAAVTVLNTSF
jgi:hypothetical protein